MSFGTLYLNWEFNGIPWKPTEVRLHIPDIDESVKIHLETHTEQYNEIAQLDVDYRKMYINTNDKVVLPPKCVMNADNGGIITVLFSFHADK